MGYYERVKDTIVNPMSDKELLYKAGKMADVVVWNGMPFSTYAKAEKVFIDGALLYDRGNRALQPRVDFILGQEGQP